ncbi:hypothetical protein WR25_13478 [Diploscapter pachys]|uniref:Uncharacterized protein n=1 Tax=Diploscapter pachys TaxID=2018661 RepID=A0A2A2M2K7_9BILA|nr:hypothetical protein WR25_13478 [Diploscapter pachys]
MSRDRRAGPHGRCRRATRQRPFPPPRHIRRLLDIALAFGGGQDDAALGQPVERRASRGNHHALAALGVDAGVIDDVGAVVGPEHGRVFAASCVRVRRIAARSDGDMIVQREAQAVIAPPAGDKAGRITRSERVGDSAHQHAITPVLAPDEGAHQVHAIKRRTGRDRDVVERFDGIGRHRSGPLRDNQAERAVDRDGDQRRDLLGLAGAPPGNVGFERLAIGGILHRVFVHRRQDHARRDAVDRDLRGREFEGERRRKLGQAALCRVIVHAARSRRPFVDRGYVDDPPALPGFLRRTHEAAAGQEGAVKVGADDAIEMVERHVDQLGAAHVEARGIDQPRRSTEAAFGVGKQRLDRVFTGHVALDRVDSIGARRLGDLGRGIRIAEIGEDDARARLRQGGDARRPDTGLAAGHYRDRIICHAPCPIVASGIDATNAMGRSIVPHRAIAEAAVDAVVAAASREHERNVACGERFGDGRALLTAAQVDVEDRSVDAAVLHPRQGAGHRIDGADRRLVEHLEEILEHHRDERFVLDDEDLGERRHAPALTRGCHTLTTTRL